jgi:transcriptional regulator with XRE-family HTH domain
MRRSGLTLRSFCREVGLDPSFFSKVLSGKRSPPAEEEVLRRIAGRLSIDAAELIVSAGRIPSEWQAVWVDPQLFRRMNELACGGRRREAPAPVERVHVLAEPPAREVYAASRQEMSEELL